MPAFVFSGLIPTDYPFAKDAQGQNLGRVEPGDEREFDQAPDQWWVPAEPGSSGTEGDPDPAGVTPDPGAEGDAGEPDESEHDGDPETEPGE